MNTPKEPKAKIIAKELTAHNHKRIDNYFWLSERDAPEVIQYLNEENQYYEECTKHTTELQNTLFEEMKSRIKEDDSSVPYLRNGYYYITRFETGKDYPIYTRRKNTPDAQEEILFDCNQMAEGLAYFQLGSISISDDNTLAAFSTDTVSRREYTIQIKNLITGEIYPEKIEQTTGNPVWAADNKTIFYTRKDQQTLRADKIYKHTIGTNTTQDQLIYNEQDDTFNTYIYRSKSKKYLIIGSESPLTSEYRLLEANNPNGEFKLFQERIRGLEYSFSHFEDKFYILTNKDKATNFKLMITDENKTSVENWTDIIPHRDNVLLEDMDIFKDYLVITERTEGLSKINIIPWKDWSQAYYLPFNSQTYTAYTSTNFDFDTNTLRYCYQSLKTPASIIDFDMDTQQKTILKQQPVLGNFNQDEYIEERIWATARDGQKIPISLIRRKDTIPNQNTPLLLYAYGSYGITMDCTFSSNRLSLLNRGFIFAIAHIRGGEDLGRNWYEDGKLLKKKNTFTDYIDCSEYLIQNQYTSANHLFAMGGSAGGLLMGVIINQAPHLYKGVIAQVPFVDVITTMLDDSIPLTTGEYDEWGNPNHKQYYDYMLSYSPYDNVKQQDYPNLLVLTGYHDSQVQYWEPAKWVAKIRANRTNQNQLLFLTNMDAGHSGASGRFEGLKELAKEYAFMINLAQ